MSKTKFSEKSGLRKSVQPIVIGVVLILIAYVAYRAYVAIQDGIRSAKENLEKKGISIHDGAAHLKVKRVNTTRYIDETQAYVYQVAPFDSSAFVKAWNTAETRGYYSRLWSKEDLRSKPKEDE